MSHRRWRQNVAQRFSAGIEGRKKNQAREVGGRLFLPSDARFAGLDFFVNASQGYARYARSPWAKFCRRSAAG